jgi:hypothetical protein
MKTVWYLIKISNLENKFGVSTYVENPKKNGVVRKGPYFANKSCQRVLGSGGSDIFENLCLSIKIFLFFD